MQLTLSDGSAFVCELDMTTLPVKSETLELQIPLRTLSVGTVDTAGRITCHLNNGDIVTGQLQAESLTAKTMLGTFDFPSEVLRRIEPARPALRGEAGPHQIDFSGYRWETWRTHFSIVDEKLAALPKPKNREGFRYGHGGNGRGGATALAVGDPTWRDYEIEFDFLMLHPSPQWHPYHIPGDARGMTVFFRAQDLHESWNQPSETTYYLGINPNGGCGMGRRHDYFMPGNSWSARKKGRSQSLTGGKGKALNGKSNHLRLRVVGNRMQVWINHEQRIDYTDNEKPLQAGEEPIQFGGVAIQWRYESLGWIKNFKVRHLTRGEPGAAERESTD